MYIYVDIDIHYYYNIYKIMREHSFSSYLREKFSSIIMFLLGFYKYPCQIME